MTTMNLQFRTPLADKLAFYPTPFNLCGFDKQAFVDSKCKIPNERSLSISVSMLKVEIELSIGGYPADLLKVTESITSSLKIVEGDEFSYKLSTSLNRSELK
ncbi:hypothetical protein BB560_005194, partial [Smittium megazygosporum]